MLVGAFVVTRVVCLAFLAWGGHRAAGGGDLGSSLISGAWHWDAHWYASIALQGYEFTPGAGSNVAFFPAAPMLMRWAGALIGHPIPAGIVLSVVESAVALVLAVRVMTGVVGEHAARRGALLLMVWPTSVFLVLPYADALLLLAAVATFAFSQRGRDVAAAVSGAVGAFTRSTGVFLAIPLILLTRDRRQRVRRQVLVASVVAAGTAAYALGLLLSFREPLGFAAAEAAGWNRVALPPFVHVGWTAVRTVIAWPVWHGRPDLFLADVVDLASIALVAGSVWVSRRRVPPALLAWPIVGLLWPLLTGTTSVGRFTLGLFPAFALLAATVRERTWGVIVGASAALLALASFSFGAGGWVG